MIQHFFPLAMSLMLILSLYALVRDAVKGDFGSSVWGIIAAFVALIALRYDQHWVAILFAFPTAYQVVCAVYLFWKVFTKDTGVMATISTLNRSTSVTYWIGWLCFHTSCLALLLVAFFRP